MQQDALAPYTVILVVRRTGPDPAISRRSHLPGCGSGEGQQGCSVDPPQRRGSIEPAYLLSKTCKRLATNRFVVAIPRRAKSAATLIALGADEIHMGLMSELGPIEPQIRDSQGGAYPALALGNALEELARLCHDFPNSSAMLSSYLGQHLDLRVLGYLKRIGVSAAQYAERLLGTKPLPDGRTAEQLANHFVNYYQDHGFVIDIEEGVALLGREIVKFGTPEYAAANEIYQFLDTLSFLLRMFKQSTFDYVGSISQGPNIRHRSLPNT